MLVKISLIENWVKHLDGRFQQAQEIGLIRGQYQLSISDAMVAVPKSLLDIDLNTVNPCNSLREKSREANLGKEWVKRYDLFDDVALWLKEKIKKGSEMDGKYLISEAGYSRIGDPVLNSRKHTDINGKPFLFSDVRTDSNKYLAKVLRWSRSDRVLAVIATSLTKDSNFTFFICDAFDSDSLLIAPLIK